MYTIHTRLTLFPSATLFRSSPGIGEAARFITQFAVPGGAAAKVAKGLGRPAQIGAFAAADVAATTPDVETLGDFLDAGPTKRKETKDLDRKRTRMNSSHG